MNHYPTFQCGRLSRNLTSWGWIWGRQTFFFNQRKRHRAYLCRKNRSITQASNKHSYSGY